MIEKKSGTQILISLILPVLLFKLIYSYIGVPFVQIKSGQGWQQLAISDNITTILTYAVLMLIVFVFFYKAKDIKETSEIVFLLIALISAIVWFILDAWELGAEDVIYSTSNIWGYVTILSFVIGFQKDLIQTIIKQCIPFAIILLVISIIGYTQFSLQVSKGVLGNSQALISFIAAFWLFCIGSIYNLKAKKYPLLLIKIIAAIFPVMALLFGARSWLIQSVLWLFVYIYLEQSDKGLKKAGKIIFYSVAIALVLFFVVDSYFDLALTRMLDKGDTRTFQYEQLFAQIDVWDLLVGQGQNFKYYQKGELYSYIDNGYLMVLMRYGVLVAIPYVACFIIPLLRAWKKRKELGTNFGYAWIILMWLMALGGLSVYNMVIIDIKSIILSVVAGYLTMLCTEKKQEKN